MQQQTSATFRHDSNAPKRNTNIIPNVNAMPANAVKIPRIGASLQIKNWKLTLDLFCTNIKSAYDTSPMYVKTGASISPTLMPSKQNASNIVLNSWAKYIRSQAIASGIFTVIIAYFRPIGSVIKPEKILPNGWHMNDILAEWKHKMSIYFIRKQRKLRTHRSMLFHLTLTAWCRADRSGK